MTDHLEHSFLEAIRQVQLSANQAGVNVARRSLEHQLEAIDRRWDELRQAVLCDVVALTLDHEEASPGAEVIRAFSFRRREAIDLALLMSGFAQTIYSLEQELRARAALCRD